MAALVCAASPARADDAAAAQALFDEATALKAQDQWAKACPKFDSSYKLDPALGTLLNLANCYEKLNQVASAWAKWDEAFQWATKNGDDRAEYARSQRDALVPRLPKLTITVKSPVAALSVERDASKVPAPMYNSAIPVDPGEHSVFVRRGDEVLRTEKVKVVEAQSAEVTLDLAAIERAAPPPPKPKREKDVVVVGVSPALRKVGWAVGGTGLGAVVVAAALEGVALSKKAQADKPGSCREKFCTAEGLAIATEARSFADTGQWIGLGGLVLAAVGVTLLIVTPSQVVVNQSTDKDKKASAPRRDVWAAPWVAVDPARGEASLRASAGLVIGGAL